MEFAIVTADTVTGIISYERCIFLPFPEPKSNPEKCKRWIAACGRENFTTANIKRWTYICSKHFVGGKGPTDANPDPIPETYTHGQVERFSRKRKAPTPRATPVSKKQLFQASEGLLMLQDVVSNNISETSNTNLDNVPSSFLSPVSQISDPIEDEVYTATPLKIFVDKGTQTEFSCSDQVANKTEKSILQNEKK